jgi:hypothetical protein
MIVHDEYGEFWEIAVVAYWRHYSDIPWRLRKYE